MFWTDEQRDVFFVLLPLTYIIGGLGYLICVHLHVDNQSCPIMDLFYNKSTPALNTTITIKEANIGDDRWTGFLVAVFIFLIIILAVKRIMRFFVTYDHIP